MAKGAIAKSEVERKIVLAFGDDFIGIDDKQRVRVWADDGGSRVQVAIGFTCPKDELSAAPAATPIAKTKAADTPPWEESDDGFDFSDPAPAPTVAETNELTDEEKMRIAELAARLGLA